MYNKSIENYPIQFMYEDVLVSTLENKQSRTWSIIPRYPAGSEPHPPLVSRNRKKTHVNIR